MKILSFAVASLSLAGAAEPLIITESTTLDPKVTYGQIIIAGSDVTLDGNGAWVIGAEEGEPKSFQDTAVIVKDVKNVLLKNLHAKGWGVGLLLSHVQGCRVEECDFSNNFHDPKFGWGEQGRKGGIVLEKASHCKLRKNTASLVWNACELVDSDDNTLEENDFSHTSNTCLKLWHASRNTVLKNNLSWGIRIDPGEVHARDSTCVLIESGSNGNEFLDNNCTHGGDGIFIRVLNGWVSTENLFIRNDCSWANNNCVEAWSPRNYWKGNHANHGSYGFWLGASDQNVLLDNEASHNGEPSGAHNSPHLPENGHAGIVFMFGPSSHTMLRGNVCNDNHGAGIAAIGDAASKGEKWKAWHWLLQGNICKGNRWGLYLEDAEEFDLFDNTFEQNQTDLFQGPRVSNLRQGTIEQSPTRPRVILEGSNRERYFPASHFRLEGPATVHVGETGLWKALNTAPDPSRSESHWSLQAGNAPGKALLQAETATFSHVFTEPGFYRLALTMRDATASDLAWRDLYVTEDLPELATEGQAAQWSWNDPQSQVKFTDDVDPSIVGRKSLHAFVSPYSGGRVTLQCKLPHPVADFSSNKSLLFWIKTRNEGTPAWQDVNPLLTLHGSQGQTFTLTPAADFLSQLPYTEAREGWAYFVIPLAGDSQWKATGDLPERLESLDLGFDSWGAPPLHIWLDGLGWR